MGEGLTAKNAKIAKVLEEHWLGASRPFTLFVDGAINE